MDKNPVLILILTDLILHLVIFFLNKKNLLDITCLERRCLSLSNVWNLGDCTNMRGIVYIGVYR